MIGRFKRMIFRDTGKVDLILDNNRLEPGERIKGEFQLKGPKSKKKVSRLECDLMQVNEENESETMVEIAATIYMSKTIDHESFTKVPFTYSLPENLPQTKYRFRTRLVFDKNVQCTDHDEIEIVKT